MASRLALVRNHLEQLSISVGAKEPALLQLTLGDHLRQNAAEDGGRSAVTSHWQGISLTYRELNTQSDILARALLSEGVTKGDRVAICAGNCIEYDVLFYAVAKIGAIYVVLNPSYTKTEMARGLVAVDAKVLFISLSLGDRSFANHISHVGQNLPQIQLVTIPKPGEAISGSHTTYQQLYKVGESQSADLHTIIPSPFDVVNLQFTSGTTGPPKAACLTHHNILNNGLFVGRQMALTKDDILCIPVPLFHCFGLVLGNLAAFTARSAVVYPSEVFNPRKVLEAVQKYRCTGLHGVPTMFIAILELLENELFDTSSLRTGIAAGTVVNSGLMSKIQKQLKLDDLTITYGMTETSPASTMTSVYDPLIKRTATVGRVLPHTTIKIVDENGNIVPRETQGEVFTAGYLLQQGYWNNIQASQSCLSVDEDGQTFMKTGDVGIMDNEGYLRIPGRLKDLIIRGGENISPSEVENLMASHPAISDVSVVAITDERYGEVVGAFVKLHEMKGDEPPSLDQIIAFAKTLKMAHYKVPSHVFYMGSEGLPDDFPKTMSGKIQKFILRDLGDALVKKRLSESKSNK